MAKKIHLEISKGAVTGTFEFSYEQLAFIGLAINTARKALIHEHDICENCLNQFFEEVLEASVALRAVNRLKDVINAFEENKAEKKTDKELPKDEVEKRMFRSSGKVVK